jgi:membrane-bound lytic murein transglycosylase B
MIHFAGGVASAAQAPLRPEIDEFIAGMEARHQFDGEVLRALFAKVQPRPNILRLMSAPSTARPWYEFRPRYVESRRIEGGVKFWAENAATLARARLRYGVPEEIIVATIGIETLYGRQIGSVKVLDALTTLAFDYPRRAEFFRGELEAYLLLGRELAWDLSAVRGSYAGALGLPQFLPSSYQKYAVDFDNDGTRNLWGDPADAIGSVANYYRSYGWEEGAIPAVPASLDENALSALDANEILPRLTVAEYMQAGATPLQPVPSDAKAALIKLETESGPQYWFGLQNFYVITRYNRSVNYAMAVYELAREIRQQREAGTALLGER